MNKVRVIKVEKGFYNFKLEQLLFDKNISINRLMRDTNTDFKVIKRIINGDVVRLDITVLARICYYLECDITDIFDYSR